MRRLRDDQAGLTLVEMLVSMTLGLIVLTGLMALVQTAQRSMTNSTERADATQRGRLAIEQIVQGLRSQVCLKKDAASPQTTIYSATPTSVSFFANIGAPDAANAGLPKDFAPQLRTYTFAGGTITEETSDGVPAAGGTYTFPTVTRTRQLVTNAAQAGSIPVFNYYGYKTDGSIDDLPLNATPFSVADLPKVAKIDVDFVVKPTDNTANTSVQTEFKDSVTLRLLFPAPKTAVQNRTVACAI
jgi:type II secretory pathway pseudopilin PulG